MAEHNIEKIVEAGGEVFNFRDPTKQPVADRVTSIRASSSAANTKYPSEKAVAVELEKMIPFGYAIFDTNPFGGKHLYINSISDAMFSMDKRYYVTATTHKIVDNGVEYPRIKEGAVETDDVYYEDSPVLETLTDSQIRSFFNGHYDSGFVIGDGKYLKIHIQFSNEANWSPSTGGYFPGYPYGDYFLSFYYSRVPENAQWRCYNRYTTNPQTAGWKKGNFGYFEGNASSVASVILKGTDNSNYQRSCIEFIVFARDGVNTMLTQIDWKLSRPTLADHFPFFTNFATQKSYVNWEFRQKVSSSPVIKLDVDNEKIVSKNLELTNALHVSYGGTGKSSVTSGNYLVGNGTSAMVEKTPKEVGSNVLSSLDDKSNASSYADFVDDDFVVGSDHVNASTISASTFVRRTALNLWNYIKSKLSGSDVNIGGNAATATNATTADTAKAYDPTFSGTNSIASALESKVTEIAFTEGNASAATDLTNVVLCGLKYYGSSLSSGRLSFTLSVTIDRGASSKGGILRVDLAIGSDGSIYCKRASLTARSGGLEISEFRLVTGTNGGKPVVGVVWNGTTTSGAYMDVRVIDYMALSASASFVYDAVLSNVSNVVWGSSNAIQSASDSGVVHISGSETITGAKEFSRSGQETNFTDSSGSESIVRARTSTSSNNGSCQLNADRTTHRFGVYGRNENGTGKWVSFVGDDGVVNLGSNGDGVRIGGTKFVFNASQLGTEADTFYWI